jgi:hypothetical protein
MQNFLDFFELKMHYLLKLLFQYFLFLELLFQEILTAKQKVESAILRVLNDLPANQRKVADYFLENMRLVPLVSIHEIARQAKVSQFSIVRFCQQIGYRVFKELKDDRYYMLS